MFSPISNRKIKCVGLIATFLTLLFFREANAAALVDWTVPKSANAYAFSGSLPNYTGYYPLMQSLSCASFVAATSSTEDIGTIEVDLDSSCHGVQISIKTCTDGSAGSHDPDRVALTEAGTASFDVSDLNIPANTFGGIIVSCFTALSGGSSETATMKYVTVTMPTNWKSIIQNYNGGNWGTGYSIPFRIDPALPPDPRPNPSTVIYDPPTGLTYSASF